MSSEACPEASEGRTPAASSRRRFLLAGAGLLAAGCAPATRLVQHLPGPAWDLRSLPVPVTPPPDESLVATEAGSASAPDPGLPRPEPVLVRADWAGGRSVPRLMRPMTRIRYITVHHDGMGRFIGDHPRDGAARLEIIRRLHRRKNWGDIGYHYAVDRSGTVWEARPLVFQGAHVRDHNEGNIGVVALGNFDEQRPTQAQVEAVRRHVTLLMRTHAVSLTRLLTHQEWAPTACPGWHLQRYMVAGRAARAFG